MSFKLRLWVVASFFDMALDTTNGMATMNGMATVRKQTHKFAINQNWSKKNLKS